MIEVVVVLILLAILTPVVISKFETSGVRLITNTDILKSHLRYAQIKAMNDTVPWGIHIPNANSYILYKNNVTANDILPGETAQTHTLTDNITVTAGVGTTAAFNEWGAPVDGSGAPVAENIIITLSDGVQPGSITVTKNTGFIP